VMGVGVSDGWSQQLAGRSSRMHKRERQDSRGSFLDERSRDQGCWWMSCPSERQDRELDAGCAGAPFEQAKKTIEHVALLTALGATISEQ